MVAFGTAGSLIPRVWKQRMMSVRRGVVLFGLVFINRGLVATGAPVIFQTVKTTIVGIPATPVSYQTATDGVVEVPITIENTNSVPDVVQIPADKSVRLVVDRREASSCSAQIYLPQLGILKDLAPNAVTVVDVPATNAGAYTLTCGMSMMSGQLIVGSPRSQVPVMALWLGLAVVGSAGALYVAGRRDKRVAAEKAASHGKKTQSQGSRSIFGFTVAEFVLVVAAVAAAIFAGLALGGVFA
jgi:hypothetical protein